MCNILLLAYEFPPDNTAGAVRPGRLKHFLAPRGYCLHVVASSLEGGTNSDPIVNRVPSESEPVRARVASRALHWLMRYFVPYNDRLPWIPYASRAGAEIIRSKRIAAIFSTSPFLAAHFAALWLKWRYGLPWIADFRDPIRDNPFRSRRWIFPYDASIERLFFRYADRLIANTDTVADVWRARYPKFSHKISVVWNSFDPRERIVLTRKPERSHRVIAHVGTLYGDRHPGRLLETLERLEVRSEDIRVKLVGPIESELLRRFQPLFDRLTKRGILEYENRRVNRDEALKETAEADYLLLLDLNASHASFQLPSKVFEYAQYGKPMLVYTSKNSPAERVLTIGESEFTAIDPRESDETENQKVAAFLGRPIELKAVSPKFVETFSASTQARIVARLLDELLGR